MAWCAERASRSGRARALALMLALLACRAGAPALAAAQAAPEPDAPARPLQGRLAAAVADRWGIDPARVRIELQGAPAARLPAPDAVLRLTGPGAGGTWIAAFQEAGSSAPLRVRFRAGVESPLAVAAHDLPRGHALVAGDIEQRSALRWGPPVPEAATPAPGWTTRRPVAAGEPLRAPAVGPPQLIAAGQAVQVIWVRGGLRLTLAGQATRAAARGERVTVRTSDGRRLEGVAVDRGTVQIDASSETRP